MINAYAYENDYGRSETIDRRVDRYFTVGLKQNIQYKPFNACNLLNAMSMTRTAVSWSHMKQEIIAKCFRKVGVIHQVDEGEVEEWEPDDREVVEDYDDEECDTAIKLNPNYWESMGGVRTVKII